MGAYRTPIIDKLKTDSASFYTFGSAIEDIGLNINERNNKVALSHYVLLNIPYITNEYGGTGVFSINNFIEDKTTREKLISEDKNYVFPKILQNYALNFETVLRNKGTYDFSAAQSVSEKIFWKTLQKSGALHLQKFVDEDGNIYYHEDFSNPDSMVIKGFGQIATSSQTSNTYNMNNETYIMIPSSYGQMKYYMTENFDINYVKNSKYTPSSITCLEGFSENPNPNTDFPIFENKENGIYTTNDSFDGVQMEFDIEDIKKHLISENTGIKQEDNISYDNLAYDSSLCLNSKYSFNTILVYYTIYDTNGSSVATNLFGAMVLNSLKEETTTDSSVFPIPYSINFNNGYPANDTLSPIENTYIDSNTQLYGSNTAKFNIPANSSADIYFIKDKNSAKELEIYFSTDGSSLIKFQFIDGTKTLSDIFSLNSTDDNLTIENILGDDNKTIFYKISYTNDSFITNFGIKFINSSSDKSININLSEISKKEINPSTIIEDNHYYSIPSYLKTQTKDGTFGSEYSFRLNIQTASIYDKNSDIIDYSSGNSTVLDDFNGVLSNLRVAIEVLKSNSVVQAKLYNDFQTTKYTALNAVSKVDTLEKDVNNLMHGNVREISSDTIDTNEITTESLNGNFTINDASGTLIGKVSDGSIWFNKINISEFTSNDISLADIHIGNYGLNIYQNEKNILSINSNGEIICDISNKLKGINSDSNTLYLGNDDIKYVTINGALYIRDGLNLNGIINSASSINTSETLFAQKEINTDGNINCDNSIKCKGNIKCEGNIVCDGSVSAKNIYTNSGDVETLIAQVSELQEVINNMSANLKKKVYWSEDDSMFKLEDEFLQNIVNDLYEYLTNDTTEDESTIKPLLSLSGAYIIPSLEGSNMKTGYCNNMLHFKPWQILFYDTLTNYEGMDDGYINGMSQPYFIIVLQNDVLELINTIDNNGQFSDYTRIEIRISTYNNNGTWYGKYAYWGYIDNDDTEGTEVTSYEWIY